MAAVAYVPSRGDIIWLDFEPQAGREQAGRRPALVISPKTYNERVGLAIVCPVTSQAKGYPFEVSLPTDLPVRGVVLADHVKNLDWRARHAEPASHVSSTTLNEVVAKILALVA